VEGSLASGRCGKDEEAGGSEHLFSLLPRFNSDFEGKRRDALRLMAGTTNND
jgi:hypothetical protein